MDLYRLVGSSAPGNLIADIVPAAQVVHVTLLRQNPAVVLPRGTVVATISGGTNAGKAVVLGTTAGEGETLTPSHVLAEDASIGTGAETVAVAYRSGCFSPDNITVKAQYAVTAADLDALRTRKIVFKDFQA